MHLHARAVLAEDDRRGLTCLSRLEVAEQLVDPFAQTLADLSADADDHAARAVPVVEIVGERLALSAADRLLAADDVPAERLVAVEERLVDAADEVARRVEVHVHLLDDHALLALDLLRVEAGVAEHVDEHVERRVAVSAAQRT